MIVPGCQNEGLLGEWHSVEKECRIEWAVFIHIDELLGSNGDDSSGKFPRFFKIDLRGVSKFFNGELGTKSSEKVTIFFLFTGDDETKGGGGGGVAATKYETEKNCRLFRCCTDPSGVGGIESVAD